MSRRLVLLSSEFFPLSAQMELLELELVVEEMEQHLAKKPVLVST